MKRVNAWITSDGLVHTSQDGALKHAAERYGNALLFLAIELAQVDKYSAAVDWLEKNLDNLLYLKELRDDITVVCGYEGDDE